MSKITNLLIIGIYSIRNLEKINDWLERFTGLSYTFIRIDNHSGGNKHMDTDILGSALNYFEKHTENFIKFLKELDWEYKTDLFIQKDEEETFTRIKLNYD